MELLILFFEFFKIGLFTFGGGYAMIPLIEEVCLKHNYISLDTFYNLIAVCESTPGPIAINMATFVGASTYGILGSIIASFGVVLPSFIITILLCLALNNVHVSLFLKKFSSSVKPIIIALILFAGLKLIYNNILINQDSFTISYSSLIFTIFLFILMFVYKLIFKKKMNTILFIVLSALISVSIFSIFPNFV